MKINIFHKYLLNLINIFYLVNVIFIATFNKHLLHLIKLCHIKLCQNKIVLLNTIFIK